ncbi:hypothetical protein EJ066_22255 [Mesorhizobium sp. M9A.F.Ca.ET.002.03.1.2]|uniref:hypothetical protein n=1 Tax=Mesorhizobium sp. M9A.F.Ca.ET.002.03.1.2 TaxID=2493668 RepID=UPI000F74DC4A|nr:hypothetical protein [Mesorhizobium sp. M9A.F.Ca.ET.002.03.1.2]AZN99624.1 hypothetical protein EJ066_22255 [Mesorhizobium sp. M9A.F.Ca.ET.002.03.1.2]
MKRVLPFVLALAFGMPAWGQTVDSNGAKRLSDDLSRYVGRKALDNGILKISVDGDAYRIAFDFDALLKMNPSKDALTFNLAPFALLVKPRSDGSWSVSSDLAPNAFLDVEGPRGVRFSVSGSAFGGIYDPGLAAFTSGVGSMAGMKVISRDPKKPMDLSIGAGTSTLNASKAAGGGVDFAMTQTIADFVETVIVDEGGSGPKVPVTMKSPKVSVEVTGNGVRTKAFLDLLGFAVANQDEASLKANQAHLKSLLTSALPLWERLEETYRFEGLSFASSMGSFELADLSATTGIDGISGSGKIDYRIKATGLTVPQHFLPSWGVALLPTDVELSFGGANLDLDSMAKKAIEAFDLNEDPPLSDEFGEALVADFMANNPKIVLRHSIVKNGNVEVTMKGEMTFPDKKPDATMTVDVAGYDKIVQAVQAAAKTDPQAAQVLPAALAVKGFAKTLSDGRLEWVIDAKADGSVVVNGAMLKPADAVQDDGDIIDPNDATDQDDGSGENDNGGAGAKP